MTKRKSTKPKKLTSRELGHLLRSSLPTASALAVTHIMDALRAERGNVTRAAELLEVPRVTLDRFIHQSERGELGDGGALAKAYSALRKEFPREYNGGPPGTQR